MEKRRSMAAAVHAGALIGTKENPLPRKDFAEKWLPIMRAHHADPLFTFQKVTPTLMLFPPPDEAATQPMQTEVSAELQAFMQRSGTGQTFQEAMSHAHGKALLLNVCTPFLEVYPKDEDGCKQLFDPHNLMSQENVVPETSVADLGAFMQRQLARAAPLNAYQAMDYAKIAECMVVYRNYLGRNTIPWRIAYNKGDTSAVAIKLTRDGLNQLLQSFGRTAPYEGERLYREESYSPFYEFGEGDYVIVDIDPSTNDVKFDKHGIPVVRTVNSAVFEATYNRAPLGTRVNAIPRIEFAKALLHLLQAHQDDPAWRYVKVAPTLVLYPLEEEMDGNGDPLPAAQGGMKYHVPTDLQTMLQLKTGQTFSEAMMKVHGKALLMNFCTPFLEAYPKDKKHCAAIYDIAKVDEATVPEVSNEDLAQHIRNALVDAKPITPYHALEAFKVARSMLEYRKALGRDGMPWRIAHNKTDATAVACKLSRKDIATIFATLGRAIPFNGERLYRSESYDPQYEWGEGDWVLMDVDPQTNTFKYDKDGIPLVRTVNGTAFECTYNVVTKGSGKRAQPAAAAAAPGAKKGKKTSWFAQPDNASDDVEEGDVEWACKKAATRLAEKCSENSLKALLGDFGLGAFKGSRDEKATAISKQLFYD